MKTSSLLSVRSSRWSWIVRLLLLVGLGASAGCTSTAPGEAAPDEASASFRFGLLTDVQYADKDTTGTRRYRDSLRSLERCVEDLRGRDLAFVVHCGDLIDGRSTVEQSAADLTLVLSLFAGLGCDVRHVIGNHCLSVPRRELLPRLGLERGYYSFVHGSWRFVVVDALALSTLGVPPDDPSSRAAAEWLEENAGPAHKNAQAWNGGLGERQREWLREELDRATAAGQRVLVFSHLPVLEAASTEHHLLWDHEEVLAILDEAPAFVAWINGHDHAGGFATRDGRAFLTVPGMVEADPAVNAYAIVEVHPDRLEVIGVGNVPSRTIEIAPAGAR